MQVLKLENIEKKFPVLESTNHLKKRGIDICQDKQEASYLWALKNINMEIYQGEIVGVIGRNGSGKTTLLKIIAGIISPSEGGVKIDGKVCGLFTLGAGFQNELSGRENIYLNGSILNMGDEEITRKYQDIVNFSELNDFIDMSLGSYSAGMRMRLGFSIAIHTDFDILLIDESLLVGDISFQKKCFTALSAYKQKGKTMILVTQSLGVIEQLCDRVYLLEDGEIAFSGLPQETCDRYRRILNKKVFLQRKRKELVDCTKKWAEDMKDWGQKKAIGDVIIKSVQFFNKWGRKTNSFKSRDKMRVKIDFETYRKLKDIHFGVALFREDGVYCYGPNTRWDGYRIGLLPGKGWVKLDYKNLFLTPGIYYLSVVIWERGEVFAYDYHRGCYRIEISGKNSDGQLLNLPFKCRPYFWQGLTNHYNSVDIKELLNKEEEIKECSGVRLIGVDFLDKNMREKNEFITGQKINIKVNYEIDRKDFSQQDLRLWVGIFRSDGIYCQGISRRISCKNKELILIYHQLRLLPGNYKVSVGFWDVNMKGFVTYYHKIYSFRVMFSKEDHGTVYLSHKWSWRLPEKSEKC